MHLRSAAEEFRGRIKHRFLKLAVVNFQHGLIVLSEMIYLTQQQCGFRRAAIQFVLASVICLFAGLAFGQSPAVKPEGSTILIIRHAEKTSSGPNLSPLGEKRSARYVQFFKAYDVESRPLHLDALFAAKDSSSSSRPRLTLVPLSKSLSKPVNTDFKSGSADDFVQKLRGREYTGKTILVCWRHGEIPDMLRAFGADPAVLLPGGKWPDDVFGWLVELHLDRTGSLKSIKLLNEKLMPGDTMNPPAPRLN